MTEKHDKNNRWPIITFHEVLGENIFWLIPWKGDVVKEFIGLFFYFDS